MGDAGAHLARADHADVFNTHDATFTFAAALGQFLVHLRQGLEQVRHQAVIGHLEDRGLFVLVDGGDHLGILHTGQMLDGAGNAHRKVKIGRHHLAGLADLIIIGHIARIHRGAAGAHRRMQPVGDLFDQLEIFRRAQAAPARDHDLGGGKLRAFRLGQGLAREFRGARIARRRAIFSIAALPPSPAALNPVVRTVMTFLPAGACTVWMALPA